MINWSFNRKAENATNQINLAPHSGANSGPTDSLTEVTHLVTSSNQFQQTAPLIGIMGAKGGVGTTTTAVNLATAIAKGGARTTLIDGDFQKPDICHILGQEPRHSLSELMMRSGELDMQLFEACALNIADAKLGLSLLSPPLNGDLDPQANLSQLAQCLPGMRSYSHIWVIDLPRHLDRHSVTFLDMCDKIVLVFEATFTGIAASHRWLNIFKELGYDEERIVCVLNRAGSKYNGVERQLSNCFGSQPILRVPNASNQIWDSSTRGLPAVLTYPSHPYTRAIFDIAKQLQSAFQR